MYRIRQRFERPALQDLSAEVHRQLGRLTLERTIQPGQSVAITVGSRGVANIARLTKAVVEHVRSLGGEPFIVPAMGSHGGGTAEGQRAVVEGYGVTEEYVEAPIRSSMETVIVAHTAQGIPVHFDKHAYEADHVIVMGRVKPHTGFVGEIESGLHKMMLIGLGKHAGAAIYHRAIADFSFETIIRAVADVVLERCQVAAGVAIVENAYDETALIEAVAPADFYEREKALLKQAVAWMPQLPFPQVDLLIVDRIGKDISGAGMDTNIVGRKFDNHAATERDHVNCKRIFVRGLTEKTRGNATGIGIAEFTTERVVEAIDREITQINCITGSHPTGGMIPLVYPNDRIAVTQALNTIGLTEPEDARVIQIRDTLHLAEIRISEVYLREGVSVPFEILSGPDEMPFDSTGTLSDV